MRHLGCLPLAIGALALAGGFDVCAAAPLDFLFGGPPLASRPAYRLRRRPAPPLQPPAELPLPVPRPHFPGDPPAAAEVAPPAKVAAPEPVKPAEPVTPSEAKTADAPPSVTTEAPPVPPPKPADLGKGAEPAAIEPPHVLEAPKPEVSKPEGVQGGGVRAGSTGADIAQAHGAEPGPGRRADAAGTAADPAGEAARNCHARDPAGRGAERRDHRLRAAFAR